MQQAATIRQAAVPRSGIAVDAAFVVAGALLVALSAQVRVPLPFTPVPITGQTFGVLLVGATLGAWRGATSLALYVVLGAVGLPFYAGGTSGWAALQGPTGGYLLGFVAAAALTGALAERGWDRRFPSALGAMLTGTVVVYLIGLPWLARTLPDAALAQLPGDSRLTKVLWAGLFPYVPGDLLKLYLAAAALPGGWWLTRRRRQGVNASRP